MTKKKNDIQIARAIVDAPTYSSAAATLGISKGTLSQRIRREPLATRLREMREAAYSAATSKLASLLVEAVETLASLMRKSTMQDSTRFTAAKTLLGFATRQRETDLATAPRARSSWFDLPDYVPAIVEAPAVHADPRLPAATPGEEASDDVG